jgi:hypothetical protein
MLALHEWRHRPAYKLGASGASKSQNLAAQRGIAYHNRVYKRLTAHFAADPAADLLIEPWFERIDGQVKRTMRQPDAILRYPDEGMALVIEVKMNWKDGRDEKLLSEYMPLVRSAFDLEVWPVLITSNIRGYIHPPLLGLQQIEYAFSWEPGHPTPVLLLP